MEKIIRSVLMAKERPAYYLFKFVFLTLLGLSVTVPMFLLDFYLLNTGGFGFLIMLFGFLFGIGLYIEHLLYRLEK